MKQIEEDDHQTLRATHLIIPLDLIYCDEKLHWQQYCSKIVIEEVPFRGLEFFKDCLRTREAQVTVIFGLAVNQSLLGEYVDNHQDNFQAVEEDHYIVLPRDSLPLVVNESLDIFQVKNPEIVRLVDYEPKEFLSVKTVHIAVEVVGIELNLLLVFDLLYLKRFALFSREEREDSSIALIIRICVIHSLLANHINSTKLLLIDNFLSSLCRRLPFGSIIFLFNLRKSALILLIGFEHQETVVVIEVLRD